MKKLISYLINIIVKLFNMNSQKTNSANNKVATWNNLTNYKWNDICSKNWNNL